MSEVVMTIFCGKGVYNSTYLRHLDGNMAAAATDVYDSPFEVGPGVIVSEFDDVIGHCVRVSLVIYLSTADPREAECENPLFRHPAIAWAKRPEFSGYFL